MTTSIFDISLNDYAHKNYFKMLTEVLLWVEKYMPTISCQWGCLLGIVIISADLFFNIFSQNCAIAQITPDTSLPNPTQVDTVGNTINITGGTKAGGNLFHSFQQFSVLNGNTAFFNNTVDIQNIISRVTGGSRSDIDGLIRANGTANLFLINPNGIVFGQNARLDIGGSFIATTANRIKFADGSEFRANVDNNSPLLTISVPLGLQFGTNPQNITVQGIGHEYNYQSDIVERVNTDQAGLALNTNNPGLQVREGQTLALVGGNVLLDGAILKAPGGRVEIAAVGSNYSINLNQVARGWQLTSDRPSTAFADIQVANKSWIGTTGIGAGEIALTGKDIRFASESIIRADTTGNSNGGGISIVGDSININNSNLSSHTFGAGNGGSIVLDAKNLTIQDDSGIFTETQSTAPGAGKAGDITIIADSIETNQSPVRSNSFGAGNGGNINVNANSLLLTNAGGFGANVFAAGNSGDITIKVGELIIDSSGIGSTVFTNGSGNAGKVNITADTLKLTDQAGIGSGTLQDTTGNAGEITLNISHQMTVNSAGISASSQGTGNGGKIRINAEQLQIEKAGIFTNTRNTDKAGEININVAGDFNFKALDITNTSDGAGNGGAINIKANSLTIQQGGGINTTTNSTGNAGDIDINVTDKFSFGGAINAGSFGAGNGGKININAGDFSINNAEGITARSDATGNGGKISINANQLQIEKSSVSTNTRNTEKTGEIDINVTGDFSLTQSSVINTSDGNGNGGKITINANTLNIQGGEVKTTTSNIGNAGDINLNVQDKFSLQGGDIYSGSFGAGNGGRININAGNFDILADTIGVISQTQSTGTGGDININVKDLFNIEKTSIYTSSSGAGNGGSINISARNFNTASAGIISQTEGAGIGGDINFNIKELFNIQNGGGVTAISSGAGDTGRINISTGNFQINGGEIISKNQSMAQGGDININVKDSFTLSKGSLYTTSSGTGNSGSIDIIAGGKFDIANSGVITETQGTGRGGDIQIDVKELVLKEPGINPESLATRVMASSIKNANAGNIKIFADQILLDGIVSISSNVGSTAAPIVTIEQQKIPEITVTPRGNTNTIFPEAVGNSGNITINANSVKVKNGAQLTTSNSGRGNAGNIKITTGEAIFDGKNSTNASGVSSSITEGAVGNGGTIEITTNNLALTNGAQLTTSNLNQGDAGNIIINAANQFFIDGVIGQDSKTGVFAESQTGQGGDIKLTADLLVLRHGALISNISNIEGAGGIDGNIDINTQLLIAVTTENSDIIAIGSGRSPGSNIQVRSQGIFGTKIRQERTPESDIVATGQVTLNILDTDPNNGLVDLPIDLVDGSRLVRQNFCAVRNNHSTFKITGRGGLPLSPDEPLRGLAMITPWVTLSLGNQKTKDIPEQITKPSTPQPIVEAQGWIINEQGQVTLVAAVPTATSHDVGKIPSGCQTILPN